MSTLIKNPQAQKVVKVATIAGAAILVAGAAVQLTKSKQLKDVLFPALSILVGVAAFSYAMAPKTVEVKSNASGAPCDCTRVNEYGQTVTWGQNCPCPEGSTTSATVVANRPNRRRQMRRMSVAQM